ncbi:hypothetical protein BKA66DRAFT_406996 [Pyrenochaeta sp. MPI-SDFR-AT-0127]|nr:hypothetical protein BKA66DRAFT_406996 [Pyrenochaeta sp. MPI-SDFR-AT-0127]
MASSSSTGSSFQFTFSFPPPVRESAGQGSSDTLCYECAQLDLEQSFSKAFDLYEETRRGRINRPFDTCRKGNGPVYLKDFYFVTSLGSRLSRPSNCKLCNFFARMTARPEKGTYKLLAICSSESALFEPRKRDDQGQFLRRPWEKTGRKPTEVHELHESLEHNVFMAVVPEIAGIPKTGVPVRWFETDHQQNGSIYRLTAPEPGVRRLLLPREVRPQADFGLIRSWLNRCRCLHSNCARRKPNVETLEGFRVIDCRTSPLEIIDRPWSERYVALSYVWGNSSSGWAPTILDAVEVTKRLGERYLWVDRMCIDQSNEEVKMNLINKMDAIYEGAEFTIVCAAGDATTGLPGVSTKFRTAQPMVELTQRSNKAKGKTAVRFAPGSVAELVGITEEEYDQDLVGESRWLDDLHFGLRGKMAFDFGSVLKDMDIQKKYNIPRNQLAWHREMAEDFGYPDDRFEDYLDKQKELARRIGIPMSGLVRYFKQQIAEERGLELDEAELDSVPVATRPITHSDKPRRPLPPNKTEGKLILVSTMQDPRTTIKNSTWATRGWTYQEGVLSNRRLVFTAEQVYWECRGMAVCESIDIALKIVHELSGSRMADYMLSGILDDDLHHASELQYGFQPQKSQNIGDQVVTLDRHIQAYTSRNLTDPVDSLKAFMGVAATYTTDDGLYLLLGLPVWAGAFANDGPGLQHTFALSLSGWTHVAERIEPRAEMYVADCPRRYNFPSWTWAGWQGPVQFCNRKQSKTHQSEPTNKMSAEITMLPGPRFIDGGDIDSAGIDPYHSDFFKVYTSKTWANGMDLIWSAETLLHNVEGTHAALLTGWTPVRTIGDPSMTWLLTIKKPMVLRHMYLMHTTIEGEWRRLMGKVVSVHLSIPITEAQLVDGHKSGHLVTVLIFASMVPYVYNGIARYLILRRADEEGRWERIGRLNMWMTETELGEYKTSEGMVAALPVKPFGKDITIV